MKALMMIAAASLLSSAAPATDDSFTVKVYASGMS